MMNQRVLCALLFGGCVCLARAEMEKVVNVGPVHHPAAGSEVATPVTVQLTKEGGSVSATVAKGRTLTVIIAGNPTTGYEWELASPVDGAVLEEEGRVEYVVGSTDRVGAPGMYRFSFKTKAPGVAAVSLKYVRPWEKGQRPEATATVNVTVTE